MTSHVADQLPTHWAAVPLEDLICDARVGLVRSASDQGHEHKHPYVRMGHYDSRGRWNFQDLTKVSATAAEMAVYELVAGDILFNTRNSEELVGKIAIWPPGLPGHVYNNNLLRLRLHAPISPWFLGYQMLAPDFQEQLAPFKSATTSIAAIYQRDLLVQSLRIAPIQEQRRIVAKLEALTAQSRRAKEALDAIPPLIEQFRQSVLAAAFRGDLTAAWREKNPEVEPAEKLLTRIRAERRKRWEEGELAKMRAKGKAPGDDRWKEKYEEPEPVDTEGLPELPEGWAWGSINELVRAESPLCYGVVQPGDERAGGVPLVRVCDLVNGTVDTVQLRTISTDIDAEYARSRLHGGEVLVSIVGTIGRVAVVPLAVAGANIARAIARLSLVSEIGSEWVTSWLSSGFMQDRLTREAREVARKTLNLDALRRFAVPIAPEGEMQQIVRQVASSRVIVARVATQFTSAIQSYGSLDRSILAKAFRGELVPQDPSDEPASVLLERIRAERSAAPVAKKKESKRTPKR